MDFHCYISTDTVHVCQKKVYYRIDFEHSTIFCCEEHLGFLILQKGLSIKKVFRLDDKKDVTFVYLWRLMLSDRLSKIKFTWAALLLSLILLIAGAVLVIFFPDISGRKLVLLINVGMLAIGIGMVTILLPFGQKLWAPGLHLCTVGCLLSVYPLAYAILITSSVVAWIAQLISVLLITILGPVIVHLYPTFEKSKTS